MNKPFTIKVQETGKKIADVINESQLPLYVIKTILKGIYEEVDENDNKEIEKYNEEQEKLSQEKEKESDK